MNVISFRKLKEFYEIHPDAKPYLTSWFKTVRKAEWKDYNTVKADFRSSDLIADARVIFIIKGNKYRMVTRISFEHKRIMIKWLGTHAAYDKINAKTI
ncbi:MAG: type II toxin-antitoxin system HigB family toxin [Dyadobacter sp.]|uniref:type II toxin-antitoxin system HigB family toxin n=1 Tax=Dyadobacter sp. TaxID=1914288 RepID=UPI001B00826E|nr:type II toxin-antitoxin system HigB family toxin [Dyadobacter sp.]MBO9616687.1 type II toxin-antitoxin system HigB family toxin [Dyadobacter sp.]